MSWGRQRSKKLRGLLVRLWPRESTPSNWATAGRVCLVIATGMLFSACEDDTPSSLDAAPVPSQSDRLASAVQTAYERLPDGRGTTGKVTCERAQDAAAGRTFTCVVGGQRFLVEVGAGGEWQTDREPSVQEPGAGFNATTFTLNGCCVRP